MEPTFFFYIPRDRWLPDIPEKTEDFWNWLTTSNVPLPWSIWNWTLQTYLHLREIGFECQLVHELPKRGIIVAHRKCLPYDLKPTSQQFFVCQLCDKNAPTKSLFEKNLLIHPYAQFHIVQNPYDPLLQEEKVLRNYAYVPIWPQADLMPREESRKDLFQNVYYMGVANQLDKQLRDSSFQDELDSLDISFRCLLHEQRNDWHDYRQADAIVAIRSFKSDYNYEWKPASKLWNAWHAGVPAILGPESAYQAERKSELDYIEVKSVAETLAALKKLKENPGLRQAMIENGRKRSLEVNAERTVNRWKEVLTQQVVSSYEKWRSSNILQKSRFNLEGFLYIAKNRLRDKRLR